MPSTIPADECHLHLVRHGSTANNLARPQRLQGRGMDAALAEEGHREAAQLASHFANHAIDRFYSSPLLRARETAAAIATSHEQPVELIEELTESDVGLWEGLLWNEVEEQYPEAYRLYMQDPSVNPYFGGESFSQVQQRVVPEFQQLLEQNLGSTILVVAHNSVNRSFLAHLIDLPLSNVHKLPQKNAATNYIRYRKGKAELVTMNWVGHLE
jgi:broad specificity phosphatase PhoE